MTDSNVLTPSDLAAYRELDLASHMFDVRELPPFMGDLLVMYLSQPQGRKYHLDRVHLMAIKGYNGQQVKSLHASLVKSAPNVVPNMREFFIPPYDLPRHFKLENVWRLILRPLLAALYMPLEKVKEKTPPQFLGKPRPDRVRLFFKSEWRVEPKRAADPEYVMHGGIYIPYAIEVDPFPVSGLVLEESNKRL